MRKLRLVLAITVVFVLAFASVAMAAQLREGDNYLPTNTGNYARIIDEDVYNKDGANLKFGLADSNAFNADGTTEYPYEIYLPNELDPANYRIHTNYTKDTDACASCHATHTAVGESLLQWYTVYDTCMACHDGTVTTTYNVWGGEIGTTGTPTFGGMFGGHNSASNHNVSGTLSIAAAPGGSTVEEIVTTDKGSEVKRWSAEFGCESCHSPHGQGGNARILHPDPNGAASAAKAEGGYTADNGLEKIEGVGYVVYANGTEARLITGYPYGVTAYDSSGNEVDVKLDNSNGYTVITPADGIAVIAKVYGTPSIKVTMDIDNYLAADESVTHKSGMNAFCGACHTDYNTENVAEPYKELNGTYSEAYRHPVGNYAAWALDHEGFVGTKMMLEGPNLECLTCHVAHGTSQNYWDRTVGDNGTGYYDTATELVELAGSSALKRAPNMATCEACHSKGEGAEGYNANTGQTGAEAPAQTASVNEDSSYYVAESTIAKAQAGEYVGSDACAECHEAAQEKVMETGHGDSLYKGAPKDSFNVYDDPYAELEAVVNSANGTDYDFNYDNIAYVPKSFGSATNSVIAELPYINDQGEEAIGTFKVATWDGSTFTAATLDLDNSDGEMSTNWNTATGYGEGCASSYCHTTGRTGLNDEVSVVERPGIQCEACHGAGAEHVKYPTKNNIFNPLTDGTNAAATAVCGACHTANEPANEADMWKYGVGLEPDATAYDMISLNTYDPSKSIMTAAGAKYDPDTKLWEDGVATGGQYGTPPAHHPQFTEFVNSGHFNQVHTDYRITCASCHDVHGNTEVEALTVMD
ncbi:MAG: hypothetical protein H0Z35_12995, partial [Thermoanaerobacteraceae bacterium]|nr:hypothetical protein [Thermoanaerobacteraceae bacterium]